LILLDNFWEFGDVFIKAPITLPLVGHRICGIASSQRADPDRETVGDTSQGLKLATMQKAARYWATEYDWRKGEAILNNLPNFITGSMASTSASPGLEPC
jgi:hypothetical protein